MPPYATITIDHAAQKPREGLPAPRNAEDARQRLEEVLRRLDVYTDNPVWIRRFTRDQIERQLSASIDRKSSGVPQPLFGLTFSIKDNIDCAGVPTTAACP